MMSSGFLKPTNSFIYYKKESPAKKGISRAFHLIQIFLLNFRKFSVANRTFIYLQRISDDFNFGQKSVRK